MGEYVHVILKRWLELTPLLTGIHVHAMVYIDSFLG